MPIMQACIILKGGIRMLKEVKKYTKKHITFKLWKPKPAPIIRVEQRKNQLYKITVLSV